MVFLWFMITRGATIFGESLFIVTTTPMYEKVKQWHFVIMITSELLTCKALNFGQTPLKMSNYGMRDLDFRPHSRT